MKFTRLVEVFETLEKTDSRNDMMEILADLLNEARVEEVAEVVYLSLGRLRPLYDSLEFNMADKMVMRAVAQAYGEKVVEVENKFKEMGDIGEVVLAVAGEKKLSNSSVVDVYKRLVEIARYEGQGSQERKVKGLAEILMELDSVSGKYTVRMVLSKLRLGFSDKTILDALSYLEHGSKEGRNKLDSIYQIMPDVGMVAKLVKEGGIEKAAERAKVTIGIPVVPALAQRLKTADEMISKMGSVIIEPKFDGTRVQIHFSRKKKRERSEEQVALFQEDSEYYVKSFTRNLDESSHMFPELEGIAQQITADEVILDSEAVGYDPKTGKMLPFQMTITRKRKHGVGEAVKEVPLKFYVFDILYKDGKTLIGLPLKERREVLSNVVSGSETLYVDEYAETSSPEELRSYHARQLEKGLEGAMVKKSMGKYLPGRQDWNWVKFKESEESVGKLSDTVDAVVMGYYKGQGKRQKFGLGAFLVGVRDGDSYKTIAKIGTGLSDEQWREMWTRMNSIKTKDMPREYVVKKILVPDGWVIPKIVVEIAADEITKSPSHTAGKALRFPRLVRFRDDKSEKEVTSLEELSNIGSL